MSERIRNLARLVEKEGYDPVEALISVKRMEDECKTARAKLRDHVIDRVRSEGRNDVVTRGSVHVYLERRQEWMFDHDPEWVAAKNRLSTIEQELIDGAMDKRPRAALITPATNVVRVYLRNVPQHVKDRVKQG